MSRILGISCYYHDAAAAIVVDGQLVAAAQEERFTRKRHDPSFPEQAIRYCLDAARCTPSELDAVVFYDKPFIKMERILLTAITTFPRSYLQFVRALPVWIKEKMWIPHAIRTALDYDGEILFTEHHMSHAASAFLVSPFEDAAILTIDGVGEWDTASLGEGHGTEITLHETLSFPHSLGLLYSAFTYYLGFRVNSAEYKVMGLAPFGEPRFKDLILRELVSLRQDGSFLLNMKYFTYAHGLRMTGRRFDKLLGEERRQSESKLTQFHKDVAASIQAVTDEIVVRMARHAHTATGQTNLCMAGGVALNCVSNSKILEETDIKDIFVQPAAGDAGGAVGAAFYVYNVAQKNPRSYVMKDAFLGPEFSDGMIESTLHARGLPFKFETEADLLEKTVCMLQEQKVVGWFQGRMEFGPRALGARSILADARNAENRSTVNLKIKFRESFRPFAPVVLEERVQDWFNWNRPSPFMLFVAQVRADRRSIPAVTHVDGSARLQTVTNEQHPLFHKLLNAFEEATGCPVLINTSFNVRGEPIVCTPDDAVDCFLRTDMDYLVIGRYILEKTQMPDAAIAEARLRTFEPD